MALPFFLAATAVAALSALDSRIADEDKALDARDAVARSSGHRLDRGFEVELPAQSDFNDAIRQLHHGSMTRPAR